jgi:hypothetical protein
MNPMEMLKLALAELLPLAENDPKRPRLLEEVKGYFELLNEEEKDRVTRWLANLVVESALERVLGRAR